MTLKDTDVVEFVPEDFHMCEVIYEGEWASYEENGWIVVFDFLGEMFAFGHENCVMSENNDFIFDPYPVSPAELDGIIEEWDNIETL